MHGLSSGWDRRGVLYASWGTLALACGPAGSVANPHAADGGATVVVAQTGVVHPRIDATSPPPVHVDAASDHTAPPRIDAAPGERRDARTDSAYDSAHEAAHEAAPDARLEAEASFDAGFLPGRPEVVCSAAPTTAPGPSTFIFDASVQGAASLELPSTGDLWPSCWSGDALFAAWGDGYGFTNPTDAGYSRPSIGVARISGAPWAPDAMSGVTVAHDSPSAQELFKIWTPGGYYQKPTGALCLGGNLYLAVQDLNDGDYGDAPAATIAVSSDSGQSWSEGTSPMFSGHVFTTVMFLDYGQDSAAIGDYVYAYGLDYNWRWSPTVTSPQGLYLARIAVTASLLDRTQWQFYAGQGDGGAPSWTSSIELRVPVLVDCTRRYATSTFAGYSVLSQGSIVYDAPRARYLYTSWTEYTYEFYESPTPWGPWTKFLFQDFGPYPWNDAGNGGYATTVPSKFIAPDGGVMWLQSNSWSGGVSHNNVSLRTLNL
jgi:hypothetical protein